MNRKIVCIAGTRPEAIKMAPVIRKIRNTPGMECIVLATAQHREMLDQVWQVFGITPDIDLDIMHPNQTLAGLTGRLLLKLEAALSGLQPAAILAQGDTTSVLVAALTSFYLNIPFGQIEAGLRTGCIRDPFPEEMNRIVTSQLARWHFAPTELAANRLRAEGYASDSILVTGNTVIDALHHIAGQSPELGISLPQNKRLILVTLHRRENLGAPLTRICTALEQVLKHHPDTHLLLPVHHNPNVHEVIYTHFGQSDRVTLCEPLEYTRFIAAMNRAALILSDSGGVQEEAPALGKPVLVLRETTERPEAVETGAARLIGTHPEQIIAATNELLTDENTYQRMIRAASPYGDGRAATRIVGHLRGNLGYAHSNCNKPSITEPAPISRLNVGSRSMVTYSNHVTPSPWHNGWAG
ncbi:MAG: non-hydrolyzing UDP-N-acetylglucosamine 2-epimerase [Paracoccus sp. (in: a-proteobacteria)]